MRYKILGEAISACGGFKRVLSDGNVPDNVLLSELDRLYAEWKSEDDFYFFLEEECETEIPALKAASDEVEFFKCLLGAKYRGVSLLSARDEKRRKESLLEEQRKAKQLAEKQEEERRKAEMAKPRGVQLWKNGPYWADRNIGAENPWDSGYYFWWGDTVGYKRVNGRWVASDGSISNFSFKLSNAPTHGKSTLELGNKGWITENGVLAPKHDAAQRHWGGNWRMPTYDELNTLVWNCAWTWSKMNGVEGYVVRGIGNYAAQSIFLPCAGLGFGTSLHDAGSIGYYWSSVPTSDYGDCACDLGFFSSDYRTYIRNRRYDGRSVRPLQGFTK